MTRASNELHKRAKQETESTAHIKGEVERYREEITRLTDALSDELLKYEGGLDLSEVNTQVRDLEVAKKSLEKTLNDLAADNDALLEELDALAQDKADLEGQVDELANELENARKDAVSTFPTLFSNMSGRAKETQRTRRKR